MKFSISTIGKSRIKNNINEKNGKYTNGNHLFCNYVDAYE